MSKGQIPFHLGVLNLSNGEQIIVELGIYNKRFCVLLRNINNGKEICFKLDGKAVKEVERFLKDYFRVSLR